MIASRIGPTSLRPALMVQAIEQLQDAKVEPDIERSRDGTPARIAVGRASFRDPLVAWRANWVTREAASDIFRRYEEFTHIFEEKSYAA